MQNKKKKKGVSNWQYSDQLHFIYIPFIFTNL